MRRLVVGLVVVGLLAVAADRVAELVVARLVADRVRAAAHLAHEPSVTFRGFPFLTQLISGHYQEVDISAHDVSSHGLDFAVAEARLRGVRLQLSAALDRPVRTIPLAAGTASATATYAALDAFARARGLPLRFAPDGSLLRVTGRVRLLGAALSVSDDARVSVAGGVLELDPLPGLPAELGQALAFRIGTGGLPFGLRLRGVAVTPSGLRLAATTTGRDLPLTR